MRSKNLKIESVNTGSMADIAFLLLIFFLVSTTILQEKGLMMQLPPKQEDQPISKVNERNLFKIRVNSSNQYLIQGEVRTDLQDLRKEVKRFVLNNGANPQLSINPQKAIISIKTNRGTEYRYFIEVLDEVKEAYYEIYGGKVGLSSAEYRSLDHKKPKQHALYQEGKSDIPMNISIAQPDQITNSKSASL
ncbi:MAG: biopolymer transporter ExbD [Cyclobacteriaceae bacterium]